VVGNGGARVDNADNEDDDEADDDDDDAAAGALMASSATTRAAAASNKRKRKPDEDDGEDGEPGMVRLGGEERTRARNNRYEGMSSNDVAQI
jgi:hypothetical protein